jgi:hypothetical protein
MGMTGYFSFQCAVDAAEVEAERNGFLRQCAQQLHTDVRVV